METNLLLIMSELTHSRTYWTLASAYKIKEMEQIAHEVEESRVKHKCTSTTMSQFGEHFKSCVWSDSNAEEGPDTCVCCHIIHGVYRFQKLLESLGPDECGEEVYYRLLNKVTV